MATLWPTRVDNAQDIPAAILFLFAAIAGIYTTFHLTTLTMCTSPYVFAAASLLLFFRRRFAYAVGVSAGLLALPSLVRTEYAKSWSSWVVLNSNFPEPDEGYYLTKTLVWILFVALVIIATILSSLRLTPTRWKMNRTWPALAVSFLVLASWFVTSVIPYSIPGYDHPAHAEFRILHVQKRGLRYEETMLLGMRDAKVFATRQQRRLFQYGFISHASLRESWRSPSAVSHMRAFVTSPQLWKLAASKPRVFRSWNAEGWYVVFKDSRLLSFESEDGAAPPSDVTTLFHELESLPGEEELSFSVRDVCLGFCYDPLAGLGFSIRRQRARLLATSSR